MDINRQLLIFTICMMAFSCLSAIIPTVVTNGLSYSYVQSPRRGCTVVGKSTQNPSFFERRTNAFECELSVGIATSDLALTATLKCSTFLYATRSGSHKLLDNRIICCLWRDCGFCRASGSS